MMIPTWIFDYIRCPITHEKLEMASKADMDCLHSALASGNLRNRLGEKITESPQAGMVNMSHQWFYPISNDIPSLIADEAIPLS
jgi:uncharacterized protein YbaR (Trm112 family)